jgi:hypothetical protein
MKDRFQLSNLTFYLQRTSVSNSQGQREGQRKDVIDDPDLFPAPLDPRTPTYFCKVFLTWSLCTTTSGHMSAEP